MAKQPQRGERSKAVRDYLKANPTASPKQVVAALKEQGMKVSLGLVSVLKYSKRSIGVKAHSMDSSFDSLIRAKKFVDQIGGVKEALAAIKTIEMLRE